MKLIEDFYFGYMNLFIIKMYININKELTETNNTVGIVLLMRLYYLFTWNVSN